MNSSHNLLIVLLITKKQEISFEFNFGIDRYLNKLFFETFSLTKIPCHILTIIALIVNINSIQ